MKSSSILSTLFVATLGTISASAAAPNTLTPEEKAAGWVLLFDGKSLDGWRASDAPGTFSVRDGAIVVHGPRSHLFYVGPVENHNFSNFEFKAEIMTFPKANSGVYFHTEWQETGWPTKGYEVQVNNSHGDPRKTGGLWGIKDTVKAPANDNEWFTLYFRVEGKRVIVMVDGRLIIDFNEQDHPFRPDGMERRLISSGTICLQGHDPESKILFRSIRVRPLQ